MPNIKNISTISKCIKKDQNINLKLGGLNSLYSLSLFISVNNI